MNSMRRKIHFAHLFDRESQVRFLSFVRSGRKEKENNDVSHSSDMQNVRRQNCQNCLAPFNREASRIIESAPSLAVLHSNALGNFARYQTVYRPLPSKAITGRPGNALLFAWNLNLDKISRLQMRAIMTRVRLCGTVSSFESNSAGQVPLIWARRA